MLRVGTSYCKDSQPAKAAETAARQALLNAGISKAETAIIFASSYTAAQYEEILKQVKRITQASQIAGASGFGILTQEIEIEKQPAVAVMVIDGSFPIESFLVPHLQESSFRAGAALGEKLRKSEIAPSSMMMFPDAFSFHNHLFFDGLEQSYGYLPLYGGLASEDGGEAKTYQMHGDGVSFDAVSTLVFPPNVQIEAGLSQSCAPVGEALQITRAQGNLIYELDSRPAYDVFLDFLSQVEFKNTNQVLQRIFLGIPLKSFQTDFTQSPYLVRNITSVNAQKGLLSCISPIEEGEFVTFTFQSPDLARQNLRGMLQDLKDRFEDKPQFGFYFNCCGRGQNLYARPNEDTRLIRQFFPETPILGFFSYGELAPVDHINHLHHYAGSLVLIAEKK